VFRELLGFNVEDPLVPIASAAQQLEALTPHARLRCSIVPHAPYSVAPALLRAIADRSRGKPISIHLGESAEEVEFLRTG
jgi:cytosine/adenosine deaminase-related metal-dependent hydrolase